MWGVPASGKSTFSRALTEQISDSLIIDKDILNESFLHTRNPQDKGLSRYILSGPKIRMGDDFYHDHLKFQSYHCVLEIAGDNLKLGKSPIIDAPYVRELSARYFDRIFLPFFRDIPHKFKMLWCYADEETIRKRMTGRALRKDDDKLESDDKWKFFLESEPILPTALNLYEHLKIDTREYQESNLEMALTYIAS